MLKEQQAGLSIAALCRKHGISDATFDTWRSKIEPRTYRYRSRRRADDGSRRRLRELAAERRRFGYRRLLILRRREGIGVNHKRLFRLYREERLAAPGGAAAARALWARALP